MSQPNPQALLKGLQLFQKAKELHAARALAAAAEAYRQALALAPDHPQILIGYGQLAEDVSDWKSAEKLYRRLMSLTTIANLDGKLAGTLFPQDRYEEAIPLFESYVARNPGDGVALRLLGTCCFRLKRFDDAIRHARQAWQAEQHPDAICLLLAIYIELGDGDALAPLVEEALSRFPDHWQVRKLSAEHLLKAGDFVRGFCYFTEMRIPTEGAPHYVETMDVPWWDGQPFAGTLLVGAEQGIGDEILTASMYGDLVAMGQRVVIEADKRLLTLLRRAYPTLTFIARNERALLQIAAERGDYRKIISGNLGSFFRGNRPFAAREMSAGGWLQPDPELVAGFRDDYRARWPGRCLVGVSWKSQRTLKSGERKDVSLASFQPLFATEATAFINLQYGEVSADIGTLPDPSRVFVDPAVDTLNDMDRLFAQVAALDLVITTSNVTAHVAGAMAKPCWVILPRRRPVIWYWGYHGDTTPWYPRTQLVRNTVDDDWAGLFARLADRLRQFRHADGAVAATPGLTPGSTPAGHDLPH